MTRRRAILELTAAYALILLVIWTPNPWQHILYIVAVTVLAAILALSFESCDKLAGVPSELVRWGGKLGLRRTNLLRSFWIAIAALILAVGIIVIAAHLHTLRAPHTASRFIERYWAYALWAFIQQILLQDVFLRRLLILLRSPRAAALAAAVLFASAHLPNPILVPITLLWGFISCLLFLHYRNIIPLAIAHAAVGITLAVAIPSPVIHNMRVGLGFLHYRVPTATTSTTSPGWPTLSHSHRERPGSPANLFAGVERGVSRVVAREMACFHSRYRSHIDHTVSTSVCVTTDAPTRRC